MPAYRRKFYKLLACVSLVMHFSVIHAEDKKQDFEEHQLIQANEIAVTSDEETKLALNNAVGTSEPSLKDVVKEKGPVILVPVVLVLLALVAVSRRKEHH